MQPNLRTSEYRQYIIAIVFMLQAVLNAGGVITNADWTAMMGHYSTIVTDGSITSLAPGKDASVYIAGHFNTINNFGAKGIAKWDGSNWIGFGSTDYAEAVAADTLGNVYIAVDSSCPAFSAGAVIQLIKKWDGTKWTKIGNSGVKMLGGFSTKLIVGKNGNLYVFGSYVTPSSFPHNVSCIAKWDGKAWVSIDSGTENPWVAPGALDAEDNIYVSVNKSAVHNLNAGIAFWNGASWSNLETRLGPNGCVSAISCDNVGNVYVAGTFDSIGGIRAQNIARWNGSSWLPIDSVAKGSVTTLVCDENGKLYAGGTFDNGSIAARHLAFWNGSTWSTLGSVTTSNVSLAISGGGTLYAGGSFDSIGGVAAKSIAFWNGSKWKSLRQGGTGSDISGGSVYACVVDRNGNMYVGGDFTQAGGVRVNYIARWNGITWDSLGSGVRQGHNENDRVVVRSLTLDRQGNLYAGGSFSYAGDETVENVAKWDGTQWWSLGSEIDGSVYSLAFDRNNHLIAGGRFHLNFIYGRWENVALWDGTSWRSMGGIESPSGTVLTNPCVYALKTSINGDLYAGGNFTTAGSASVNDIARWDGTAWSTFGPGWGMGSIYEGSIRAIEMDPAGNIYIGGYFQIKGDTNIVNVARWNGTAWAGLNGKLNGEVLSLSCGKDGSLYVGGKFTAVGSLKVKNIAKWDVFGWDTLGSGVDSMVNCFTVYDSILIAGGTFTTAGGKQSPRLAGVKIPNPWVGTVRHSSYASVPKVTCRLNKSMLFMAGLRTDDRIRVYSVNGILLFERYGTGVINLHNIATQPLIIRVENALSTRFVRIVPLTR